MVPLGSSNIIPWLEESFPPRCKKVDETEAAHQFYAGKVALAAQITEAIKNRQPGENEYVLQLPA